MHFQKYVHKNNNIFKEVPMEYHGYKWCLKLSLCITNPLTQIYDKFISFNFKNFCGFYSLFLPFFLETIKCSGTLFKTNELSLSHGFSLTNFTAIMIINFIIIIIIHNHSCIIC